MDGVVILFSSLPGGTAAPYNQGDTATHEIGHWIGLYHTFQGGCSRRRRPGGRHAGRGVAGVRLPDRPRHLHAQPGLDPITNFMDYTDDSCMYEFTSGQSVRAAESWTAYRA